MSRFLPPEPLTEAHDLGDFSCGEASLDDWLKRRARANQASGASRTYVVCEDNRVVGYYAVAVLARLAVDRECQGQGIGRALFRDAARRVTQAADAIGIRGIVVHAISEEAKGFYLALGFDPSPREPMTLMVTLADVRAVLL